jgi:hypothetical protein
MKVKEVCLCGATFEATDDKGTFLVPGGKPDKNGDVLLIEKHLRNFRKLHRICIKKPSDAKK